jgi:hypothetical protein
MTMMVASDFFVGSSALRFLSEKCSRRAPIIFLRADKMPTKKSHPVEEGKRLAHTSKGRRRRRYRRKIFIMIGWEIALIIGLCMVIYRHRQGLGHFLASALELLSDYNDQYDHGEHPTEEEEDQTPLPGTKKKE